MNIQDIAEMQEEQGYSEMQFLINSGHVWQMEGAMGRSAIDLIKSGACMLPESAHRDYYGNKIPARTELKEGTQGTLQNTIRFYTENNW